MTHRPFSRSYRYRERLSQRVLLDATDVRRCRSVAVPRDLSADIRHGARDGDETGWLAVFEDELAIALADYAAYREDGIPTHELADYIAYLNACVTSLEAAENHGGNALAAIAGFARVRTATGVGGFSSPG